MYLNCTVLTLYTMSICYILCCCCSERGSWWVTVSQYVSSTVLELMVFFSVFSVLKLQICVSWLPHFWFCEIISHYINTKLVLNS